MCALGDFLALFAPVLRQIARYLPHHRSENASKTHPKSSHDKFKTASEEYAEVLHRLTDYETADYVVKTILNSPFVELITPYFHFNLITADLDDNKFVDCAISANAHYIVTNDHHYDVLKSINFPNVNVINIKQFCLEFD